MIYVFSKYSTPLLIILKMRTDVLIFACHRGIAYTLIKLLGVTRSLTAANFTIMAEIVTRALKLVIFISVALTDELCLEEEEE